MTDKVQKIRELYEYWKEKEFNSHSIESEIRMSECKRLLLVLDSLLKEPASEDLSEAASIYQTFHRYATPFKAYIDGANWQKQQVMEKAVEREVKVDAGGYPYIPQMELYDYDKDIPLAKEGDKYKVILIKED